FSVPLANRGGVAVEPPHGILLISARAGLSQAGGTGALGDADEQALSFSPRGGLRPGGGTRDRVYRPRLGSVPPAAGLVQSRSQDGPPGVARPAPGRALSGVAILSPCHQCVWAALF